MDQHTARTPPPPPPPGPTGEVPPEAYPPPRPARPLSGLLRRLRSVRPPRARLTGLGTGLLTTAVTVLGGAVDATVFNGPGLLFGLVFVLISVVGAVYVRPYDLVAAPVAAPIAFAAGILLTSDGGGGGLVGHLLGVFTGLALLTGWLYTGTVLAAMIVGIRALLRPSRRRRSRRCSEAPRERSRP
ncbi:DUF6542 domain-containing protein [Streptomyces sp. NBC_01190]|uniref:DUF6542 domain-containing protein n=1 Tax=Streptomyces sp. NBC_01190 TaxID=2903767 RepID=UPI00386F5661|nr:hypothetical protein OG519_22600 [Streptomyces sp. NBC_01190]